MINVNYAPLCLSILFLTSCTTKNTYSWAFAQNMDGSFLKNEFCRESLAKSVYDSSNKDKIKSGNVANIFIFKGVMEEYRIYGFNSKADCDLILNQMMLDVEKLKK